GIAKHNDKLITIVDFEKILIDISPNLAFSPSDIDKMGMRNRSTKPILLAEDSPLLERLILSSLEKAGYMNVICTSNGKEAWEILEGFKATGQPIEDHVCAVITDIEMPLMDGHRLLKLIKEDDKLRKLPVVVFSSLVTDGNRAIGNELGAVASISKPEIVDIVDLIDRHIL
ncbi:MAG: response regulator, partial [Clostridiales bacterium]|nr:response regulator [Clostridiales bacterium]